MKRFSTAAFLAFCFAAAPAFALRDDLPADPLLECTPSNIARSDEFRDACGIAAIERACARGHAAVAGELAGALGVNGVQAMKAIGRVTVASLEKGDLCARGRDEWRQAVALAMNPKKVRSESPKAWLLQELAGPSGEIDHGAVASALEERKVVVSQAGGKRAGLPATPAGWTNLTGYSQSPGRVNHLLFLDGTGNNILAGADGGGIWRTSNGGAAWTPVNDFLGSLSITNFAKAANDANTIYAGTNTSGSHTYFPFGIVKSTDGGLTWNQLAQTNPSVNADFAYVQRVAVHPANSAIVLAATQAGAYESTNGGTTWTKIGGIATKAYYAAIHPTDANRRAVAYNDGTVRFTTTGDLHGAGASTATVLAGGRYMKLAYAKSDTSRLYALVTDGSSYATRLFMSTTGGASWTEVPSAAALTANYTFYNSGYLSYTGGLWVDPLNANRVAVCEAWAAFTVDITQPSPDWKSLYSGWVDFHGIVEHPAYDGTSNRTVFFVDDGGVYRVTDIDTLDTFASFARVETGMTITQVYSVSGHGGNPILGAQDVAPKVYRTDTGDPSLKWRFTKRPPTAPVCPNCSWIGDGATTAASTANPLVLYGSRQYLDMIRSNDGGATAVSIVAGSALNEGGGASPSNYNAGFIAPFVLDPSNPSRMLAGGHSLWRTTNADTGTPPAWTAIRAPFADSACSNSIVSIAAIAIAPSNPDIVWVAHSCAGRLFRSANATQASPTWTEVTTYPSTALYRSKTAIAIDPANPDVVWIGLGAYQSGTLFRTTDGGATAGNWTTVPGLPGAPVYSLLMHPANSSWLYAGTGVGLFASADGGATWSTTNEGPANIVVRSLDWNTTGTTSELLVGTYGRGVYKASIASAAPTTTTTALAAAPGITVTYGTTLTLTATVTGTPGTPTGQVTFKEGATTLGSAPLDGLAHASLATSTLAAGSHGLTATYAGDGTFASSASPTVTITVNKAPQAIVFGAAPTIAVGGVGTVAATGGNSGNPVTFTSLTTGTCTVSGSTVAGVSAGTCTIAANQAGNANYLAAAQATQDFAINAPAVFFNLSVALSGSGTVTSSPAGINCGTTCLASFASGTEVTLTPSASAFPFTGWSGACTGSGACTVTMDADKSVTASFFQSGPQAFTVTLAGTGSGTVISTPAGINCPGDCSQVFSPGTTVTLTATPAAGSAFVGWNSPSCPGSGPCQFLALSSGGALTATFDLVPNPPRLANISTRGPVFTGNDVMIGGFIIGGSAPKKVLVTARGPSLAAFGVPGVLPDPTLQLYSGQAVIASNDNWQTNANSADITATGVAPTNAFESALLVTLSPGAYTAIVSGVGGTTGVGIVEVFEADHPEIPLINISTRGQVQTVDNVMIGGFIIYGNTPQTVLITARGPSLVPFGITNALSDPKLEIYSGATKILENDDFGTAANFADIMATGVAPTNAKESAILVTLSPGAYTAIVSGVGGVTGVGIVEVFAQ